MEDRFRWYAGGQLKTDPYGSVLVRKVQATMALRKEIALLRALLAQHGIVVPEQIGADDLGPIGE